LLSSACCGSSREASRSIQRACSAELLVAACATSALRRHPRWLQILYTDYLCGIVTNNVANTVGNTSSNTACKTIWLPWGMHCRCCR
jgi:hypothetical protein